MNHLKSPSGRKPITLRQDLHKSTGGKINIDINSPR